MGTTVTAPEPRIGLLTVFATLLASPTLWSLHLLVSYFLVALDCTTAWGGGRTAILIATALFAAAAAAAGLLAWRRWREIGGTMLPGELLDPVRIRGFLLLSGVLLAPPFTLLIVLQGISPLFAPMCR